MVITTDRRLDILTGVSAYTKEGGLNYKLGVKEWVTQANAVGLEGKKP